MKIISASIDLNKIDKSRIKEHKNGAKYYQLDIFIYDEKNQYDQDVSIATGQTKEERDAEEKKTYLGNGKVVYSKDVETKTTKSNSDDDLAF